MAEIFSTNNIKTIALYLPQFHAIPENDRAHGEGFTEWTNTRKAEPLFEGHYQPRTPYEENYYNLLDDGVMERQAQMANEYGVYGFCYYHYWFKSGKKLLEKPVENMLKNRAVDIPFCLSWANENWSKRWDGGNHEIIMEQDYGNENEWENHFQYLLEFFKDDRYITINNAPLLFIYKPEQIPKLKKMIRYFKKRTKENGFSDLCVVAQYPKYYCDRRRDVFDYYAEFEPAFTYEYRRIQNGGKLNTAIRKFLFQVHMDNLVEYIQQIKTKKVTENRVVGLDVRDYDEYWSEIIHRNLTDEKMILGAFVDWDNTPRNKNGVAFKGASPEKFEKYFSNLVAKVKKERKCPIVLINAWNEWAEGCYLEPDQKYGFSYLEAIRSALKKNEDFDN